MLQSEVDLVAQLPSGGYLVMSSNLLEKLHQYRQLSPNNHEAGGILIGNVRISTDKNKAIEIQHIELTNCTFPKPPDTRSRFSFHRRSKHHVQQTNYAWKRSGKQQTYLGEWHTHPEPDPLPSINDLRGWQRKLNNRKVILIIIGQATDWIAYWDGSHSHTLTKLFN
jgi:integrative and conjugative element protein (TIGR02256 family)